MSWGERSCSQEKAPKNEHDGCSYSTIETCNVDCPYYTWDKKTQPDSGPALKFAQMFEREKPKRRQHKTKNQLKRLRKKKR